MIQKEEHLIEVVFVKPTEIKSIGFMELFGWYKRNKGYDANAPFQTKLKSYGEQLWDGKKWIDAPIEQNSVCIRIHTVEKQKVEKVRLLINEYEGDFGIVEMLVY